VRENQGQVLYDGISTAWNINNATFFKASIEAIEEFKVHAATYSAEYGHNAGAQVEVLTRSGTNTPHGEFYFIGRPVALAARPMLLPLSSPKPDLTLADYAVNGSGAIVKDKLFVFGGYEHLKRGLPQPNTIAASDATAIGLSPDLLKVAPSIQYAQFANFRIDWTISNKHQAFLRYNYFRNNYPFNTAVGGKNAIDAASDFQDRAHVLGAQVLSTFSPTVLNELRFGWPYRNEHHFANPLTGKGPQINISGIAIFNGSTGVGDRYQEKVPNLNDSLTVIRGKHTLKAGFGFQQNQDTQTADVFSQYNFSSVANYLLAKSGANPLAYSSYSTVIGLPGAWYHSFFWNWFAQDSFQVRPNLLLIFGVRYDRYQGPSADPNAPFIYSRNFRTPGKDFAPRFGLAWSVTPKTVVRASIGMFYEPVPTNLWYNTFINSGNPLAYSASIPANSPLAPAFPNVIALSPGLVPPSADITTITPNFRNAYTINTSIQVTQALTRSDSLTVGYVNTGARELTYLRNMNLINPTGFLADGRPIYSATQSAATRFDPRFNNITLQDVGAITSYNAMIVNLQHRMAKGFQVSASYTWSHSISDAPDANSFEQNLFIEDNTSRLRDRGNSIVNRPSALTLSAFLSPHSGSANRVWNWLANNNDLALLGNFSSGDQQNITSSRSPLNGDSKAATRPLFIGRDTVRTPNIYQFDVRYTRTFFTLWDRVKPKFIAEVNNLFNRENITSLTTAVAVDANGLATPGSNFLQPSSTVLEKRIVQFGVRVDW